METGKILTGNLLLTGDAVFYAADGSWSVRANEAHLATSDDEIAALTAVGEKAEAQNTVVSLDIIEAARTDKGVWPTRNREQIRAKGPTTHPHMGYQSRFDLTAFEGA